MLAFERVLRIQARRPDGKLSVGSATLISQRLALTAVSMAMRKSPCVAGSKSPLVAS